MLGYVEGGASVKRVEIQRVENGWVVNVYNPMMSACGMDAANMMTQALPLLREIRKGLDGDEPWRAQEDAPDPALPKAKAKKPMETHVFLDKAKMLKFVSGEMA